MSINLAALDIHHCQTTHAQVHTNTYYHLHPQREVTIIFLHEEALTTKGCFSALARGYPSWFCYYKVGPLEPGDVGPTHHCCDQYENNGTPGVKFTGSWASKVRTGVFLLSVLFVNLLTCLVVQ
jgi:hypothetical protein